MLDGAIEGKPEFKLRLEPGGIARIARPSEVGEDPQKILPDEMRKHETIVQGRAPTHQNALLRFLPKPSDERPQE
jgi:hypothetical protein